MSEWQPIETAPKEITRRDHANGYGCCVLAYPVHGSVARVRWWQRTDRPEACNFLTDGHLAVHPTHWMPLPDPPRDSA